MATVDINSRPLLSFTGRYNNPNGYVMFPVVSAQNAINYGGGAYLGQINNKYYLVPNMGSSNACSNSSYRYKINSSTYQSYLNAYGSAISYIFPNSPSEDSMVAYPAEYVNNKYYLVDIQHPEFLPFNSACSPITYASILPVYKSSIEVEDSGSGGGSYDDTNLISAVLMIPATLICLACMAVIFKMFINRRVRG